LLEIAKRELNTRSRSDIKSVISPAFAEICSSQIPVTEFLFGDSIAEELKLAKKAFNLVSQDSKRSSNESDRRYMPYRKNHTGHSTGNLNYRGQAPRERGARGNRCGRRETRPSTHSQH